MDQYEILLTYITYKCSMYVSLYCSSILIIVMSHHCLARYDNTWKEIRKRDQLIDLGKTALASRWYFTYYIYSCLFSCHILISWVLHYTWPPRLCLGFRMFYHFCFIFVYSFNHWSLWLTNNGCIIISFSLSNFSLDDRFNVCSFPENMCRWIWISLRIKETISIWLENRTCYLHWCRVILPSSTKNSALLFCALVLKKWQ